MENGQWKIDNKLVIINRYVKLISDVAVPVGISDKIMIVVANN